MAGLEDFTFGLGASLEDFRTDEEAVPKVRSKASDLNMATHASILAESPESIIPTYRTVNAEYEAGGKSPTADRLIGDARQKSVDKNKATLVSVLTDPSLPDEVKKAAALGALDIDSAQYDINNVIGVEALSAPVKKESVGAETSRIDMAPMLAQSNAVRRGQQAILNSEMLKESPDAMQTVGSFVEYIMPFVGSKMAGEIKSKLTDETLSSYGKAALLEGSVKMDLREVLSKIPPDQRLEATQRVVDIINNASTIVLPGGNDLARKDYLATVLDQGSYDDADKWVDNVFSVLDVVGVGALLSGVAGTGKIGVKASEQAKRIQDAARNVKTRLVKTRVQPSTVSQVLKDTNPDKAKATFAIAMTDETEEGANALYGASKEDVVSDTMMPELLNEDGSVMNKVGDVDQELTIDDAISNGVTAQELASKTGKIHLFQSEKASATAAVVEGFVDAIGMTARKEMFQVGETGDGIAIRAVYGPTMGGHTDADSALAMARWSLAKYGVTDDQIKLMVRTPEGYRAVGKEEFDKYVSKDVIKGGPSGAMGYSLERQPKDYLIAVDHTYTISPGDVSAWAEADVKYNIFDRVLGKFGGDIAGQGSVQRHVFDVASLLNPVISKGAAVAVDRAAGIEKVLLDKAKVFAEKFSKSDADMQGTMRKLIDEANEVGKDFNYNEMVAAGLRDTEISAMKAWREYWDELWRLENADTARTLKARGYYEYVDESSDTRLFAKPIAKAQTGKVNKVLNPATGRVARISDDELTALYAKSGTLAQLRRPVQVGDESVDYIRVENTVGGNYLRGITDSSAVLNYRKGYYAVKYKDPYFVVKRVTNKRGELLYTKAVASAGSLKDAEALAKAKGLSDGGEYFARQDIKNSDAASDDTWDLFQAQGRSAQRIRGKRLEEPDSYVTDPSMSNIVDPVESMLLSARSAANRVAMRDMIETTKARFSNQYAEFLPTGKFGQKEFPADKSGIAYRGEIAPDSKKLADARTTYEYIKYLEDGYINGIDESYKVILKNIAEMAGNAGLDKADKALRWMAAGRGPSAMGKNIAFNLYLALNPIRQFIVQSHQAVQLVANYPRWIASGQATGQVTVLMAMQMGIKPSKKILDGAGLTANEAAKMYKQFQSTGQVAAIDKQNLVRGALLDLSDQMNMGKSKVGRAWKITTMPLTWSRKVGFDAGENINTMTAWLANRDSAIRAGKDMDKADVQAEVAAAARNYTYNMNAAGDMPYNQNTLAAVFQFMQVPHKALLGMTFNRQLTAAQKARLVAFNATMYTLPPAAMYDWFGDVLPDNQEAREAVVHGAEGWMLNKLLSLATGEKSSVDFSSLSAADMYGTYEFIHEVFSGNFGAAMASSPSGQLFFGNNPRLTNFARTAARYFNLIEDYEDETEFGQVALEFAKLSSGLSNAYKAAYALEYQKRYGATGTTNPNVPTPNAIAMVFGFQSIEDAQNRFVGNELYEKSDAFRKDVQETYRITKQHLISKNPGISSNDLVLKITSEAWRVYGNDNFKAKMIIDQMLRRDIENKDASLYNKILRDHEIFGDDEMESLIKATPYEDEAKRQQMLDTIDFVRRYREED